MGGTNFFDRLHDQARRADSLLCVGLDPSLDLPAVEIGPRMRAVIEATHPHVCAYKPNIAFYEARGATFAECVHKVVGTLDGVYRWVEALASLAK